MLALIVTSPYPDEEDPADAARDTARQQNVMESHVLGARTSHSCNDCLPPVAILDGHPSLLKGADMLHVY